MVKIFASVLLLFLLARTADGAVAGAQLVEFRKIWDRAPHNAFTDLTHFNGKWYCVFREGTAHVSPDGAIRVLSTDNGFWWEPSALIKMAGYDLRDPKISVHPDGKRLMLLAGATRREDAEPATLTQSVVAFSDDGKDWGEIFTVGPPDYWLWRVSWHKNEAYAVAYDVDPGIRKEKIFGTSLFVSTNGTDFKVRVGDLYAESGPTEATLRFGSDDTMYCLQRRDGKASSSAMLGTSKPPYTDWTWTDLETSLGGPDLIQIPDGRWIACGRMHDIGNPPATRTVVAELDVARGKLIPLIALPSRGDSSYPGMLWHKGMLWISYYSSHEGKAAIYLAKLKLSAPTERNSSERGADR